MKKVKCVVVMCLAASVLLASRQGHTWEYFEAIPEAEVARLREEFRDAGKLEMYFCELFWGWFFIGDVPQKFKRKFDVNDETMRTALMGIVRASSGKAGWGRLESQEDIRFTGNLLETAVKWLGACADAETKKFLMGIATDDAKWYLYRLNAIGAYLHSADAQEARDALLRFLVGDTRENPRSIYLHAIAAYDEAGNDPLKREAIAASLAVVLAQEDNKNHFAMVDKRLAQRSKEYAESSQRLAMLNRINRHPPTNHVYTDSDLKAALESFKSRTAFTSVSTNLTELMARDFRKPKEKPAQ